MFLSSSNNRKAPCPVFYLSAGQGAVAVFSYGPFWAPVAVEGAAAAVGLPPGVVAVVVAVGLPQVVAAAAVAVGLPQVVAAAESRPSGLA